MRAQFIVLVVIIGVILCAFVGWMWSRYRDQKRAEREAALADFTNMAKAKRIVREIAEAKAVQKTVKDAFLGPLGTLEGGLDAAVQHPLYLEAEDDIRDLQLEFLSLV